MRDFVLHLLVIKLVFLHAQAACRVHGLLFGPTLIKDVGFTLGLVAALVGILAAESKVKVLF